MRTLLKILGWTLGVLLVLLILAGAGLWFGGGDVVAWAMEHPLSQMIGRQITVAGPLTVRWGAPTEVVIENVRVANADWAEDKEMFSADRVEIEIFARTLLRGPIRYAAHHPRGNEAPARDVRAWRAKLEFRLELRSAAKAPAVSRP